jgi:class 3 adenylate cyclase/tetratricopeptide (TPR) repeat protein
MEGRRPQPEPFAEQRSGVILLLDISGFTALTTQFAAKGAAGAEELSGILNRFFGRVANIIVSHGGDILAFAGDSALVMWTGDDSHIASHVARAAQAALQIQSELHGYQPASDVTLTQRAGIGCGTLQIMELGGLDGRWQFLVTGDPILQAARANHDAGPGQVLLSSSAWSQAQISLTGKVLPSGFVCLEAVVDQPSTPSRLSPILTEHRAGALSAYLPPVVSVRLLAGQEEWLAEFRNLTVLFVNIPQLDRTTAIDSVQQGFRRVQETLRRFEGSVYQFLMDDKGLTVVCAFGLPPLAHEDDARRALEASSVITRELATLGLHTSTGVATGTVFCGVYGSDHRRQYTMLGSAVNLAARLMQASENKILCDEATCQAARGRSLLKSVPWGSLTPKGWSTPVPVYELRGPLVQSEAETFLPGQPSSRIQASSIVGREAERRTLKQCLATLEEQSHSNLIVVEGEAGVGKSCLLEDFLHEVRMAGVPCWHGAADPIEQSSPYFAWRSVFRDALDLNSISGEAAQRDHILKHLPPHLAPLAPLLNAVLPLNFPESPTTASMEGQARAENSQRLLVAILETAARSTSRVLILEDVHWLDSASWRLVLAVSQKVHPLLLILSTRPISEPQPAEYRALTSMPSTRRFNLDVLSSDDAFHLVCLRLGVTWLPPEVAKLIRERANGHPLFSEQLAYALRDSGLLQVAGGKCLIAEQKDGQSFDSAVSAMRFPGTVQGIITSRLDRLFPAQQLAVKVASIIGQNFDLSTLQDVYPVEADRAKLVDSLQNLEELDLTRRVPDSPGSYVFKHAITQDVAYHSVPFAQRRQLHQSVGEWYERRYADDLPPHYPLLAYHWRQAEVVPKALHYCSEAGNQALRNYANPEAVKFLSDALALESHQGGTGVAPSTATPQKAFLELQLGKAYVNWSKYTEGRAHLEQGLELQKQKVPANMLRTIAALFTQVARQCLHRLWPGRYVGLRKPQRETLLQHSRTFEALTEIYFLQDMSAHCLLAVFRSLNLAELAGYSPELARGYSSAGSLVGFMGLHGSAKGYFKMAERVSGEINDAASSAWVCLAKAMYCAGVGQWDLAIQLLRETIAINDRLGDRRRGDDARIVLGIVEYLQGNFLRSINSAEALYSSAGERLDARCQAEALRIKAYNLLALGRHIDLLPCLQELDALRSTQVKFGGIHQKQDVHSLFAVLHVSNADYLHAREQADQAAVALAKTSNSFFDYLLERSAIAQVYLTLLRQHSGSRQDDAREALATAARKACAGLKGYSRVFPIGRPLTAIHDGQWQLLRGRQEKALRLWREALRAAQKLQAPYDQALAHACLGNHLPEGDPEKPVHLQQASEIFERLGAPPDLHQTGVGVAVSGAA